MVNVLLYGFVYVYRFIIWNLCFSLSLFFGGSDFRGARRWWGFGEKREGNETGGLVKVKQVY